MNSNIHEGAESTDSHSHLAIKTKIKTSVDIVTELSNNYVIGISENLIKDFPRGVAFNNNSSKGESKGGIFYR